MNELARLTRRLQLAKRMNNGADPDDDGSSYDIGLWARGRCRICARTGHVLEYETFGGRLFRGPDVQPQYDVIVDNWLEKWDKATWVQQCFPMLIDYPEEAAKTLPPHVKAPMATLLSQHQETATGLDANDQEQSD